MTNPLVGPLIKTSTVRTYAKGQTILYPDEDQGYIYLLKSGAVMMHDIDDEGNRKILYIFAPPTLFPMVSFLEEAVQSSWFYTTLVDSEVYIISYNELKQKLQDKDGFAAYNSLLRQSLKEVHELLLHITDHLKTDSNEKIISILLFLLAYHTKTTSRAWRPVLFPVSHQLMAEMTGLTRETITLAVKELASKKLLRYVSKATLELNYTNLSKQKYS